MKFKEIFEGKLNPQGQAKMQEIYDYIKQEFGNDTETVHYQIKSRLENKYVRFSNKETEALWDLFKADKNLKDK